ncbi:uracil-DNA glycosylase [Candidatus Gromoviella agglomerans]|uniref:uracil-DNA glycosylase n=1 Tax=Candidatus Gromoviella agglomerans TaxID=2806609 RepID=UPI001E3FBC9C|nr:uracil-DNA glycosylase [Candidatus Gromoviella agglomerans]UFX98139.1 Uracil DNA glycosylase superfamily protein [Candidatus Gromoviella agglomerans]
MSKFPSRTELCTAHKFEWLIQIGFLSDEDKYKNCSIVSQNTNNTNNDIENIDLTLTNQYKHKNCNNIRANDNKNENSRNYMSENNNMNKNFNNSSERKNTNRENSQEPICYSELNIKLDENQQKCKSNESIFVQNFDDNDKVSQLIYLKHIVHNIDCDLKYIAKSTVFGDGNVNADVMLIGEAPGEEEDNTGMPFVGKSGQLLQKAIEAIGLSRQDVYITNILPWRPPYNRQPKEDEIKMCMPYLEKHISIISPKFLILVGSISAKSVMSGNISNCSEIISKKIHIQKWNKKFQNNTITEIRGECFFYKNQFMDLDIITMCVFHPSYLLRSPTKKQDMWRDMFLLKSLFHSKIN